MKAATSTVIMRVAVSCSKSQYILLVGLGSLCLLFQTEGAKVELDHLIDKNFTVFCDPRYYRDPSCLDSTNGYKCLCGSGFAYNSQGMCISVSTNSLLQFSGGSKSQYVMLVGKPDRALDAFTMTFWFKIHKRLSSGYIVSYSVREHPNIFYMKLENGDLVIQIYNETMNVGPVASNAKEEKEWKHLAFSWDSKGGKWAYHVNGVKMKVPDVRFGSGLLLPASGETTLGARSHHFSRLKNSYDDGSEGSIQSLQMDISHFHVWFSSFTTSYVRKIMKDCHLKYCGTAVRWTDFRDGTRGAVRLRWPSGVHNQGCFGEWNDLELTCDKYCSVLKGARCREEMMENVHWNRSQTNKRVDMPCPGKNASEGLRAYRNCHITTTQLQGSKGKWDEPEMAECLNAQTRAQMKEAAEFGKSKLIVYDAIFPFLDRLIKSTRPSPSQTPSDLSAYIEIAEHILDFENDRIRNKNWLVERWQNDQATKLYPNSTDVKHFMQQFITIFDNLLPDQPEQLNLPNGGNHKVWMLTKPFGQLLVHLLSLIPRFVEMHSGYLMRDVFVERSSPLSANFSQVMGKVAITMEVHYSNRTATLRYPRQDQLSLPLFAKSPETRTVVQKKVWLGQSNLGKKRAFVVTTVFIANVSQYLPNPAQEGKRQDANKLNSALYYIKFFPEDPVPLSLRDIVSTYSYLQAQNISNVQCFRLDYNRNVNRKSFGWRFKKEECDRVHTTISRVLCTCNDSGYFSGVTTDMFDPQWMEEKDPQYFMNWATYFGCAMSALCSLLGFCILVFLRTTSNTSTLHKNTALAVGFAQLSLMCGIDLHEFLIPCRVFTIATLYFILCLFCWMMNQAFHIYSVVTYSVHNNDEVEDGSVAKFMIMGWVVPIIPVLIGAWTKWDKFFNKTACFVSWDWFLIVGGPGVGIVFVTLLMKVIALKEYMQSSYSLSEKANKLVVNYMKAGRSQWGTVLAMYCCLLVALRLQSTVLKFLFAIFSILQGSSLLCFSVLMNDEVRSILQNTYEGPKDKEEMDIMEELAEITHTQNVLAAHRLSKQRSLSLMKAEKEGSFLKSSHDDQSSSSPTNSHQGHASPEPTHKMGFVHQILDVLGKGAHVLAAGGEGGFISGGPCDVQGEHTMGFLDDTAMMDTHV